MQPGCHASPGHPAASPTGEPPGQCCPAAPVPTHVEVPDAAKLPMMHAQLSGVGLVVVCCLRVCIMNVYSLPAGLHWTAHMLSVAADSVSISGAVPVFSRTCMSACVEHRCLGSLMTLLVTAVLCDAGASAIFLSTAGSDTWRLMQAVATEEGAPRSVAFIGVWECLLLSSFVLEATLCISAWRFYCVFREAGLYPPDAAASHVPKNVSPFELVCEAEDVALLSDQCNSCGIGAHSGEASLTHGLPIVMPVQSIDAPPGIPLSASWLRHEGDIAEECSRDEEHRAKERWSL